MTELTSPPVGLTDDWPSTLQALDGRLVLDGCDVGALARAFGTPAWVISEGAIRANYRAFMGAWAEHYPSVECAYSMKANNTMAVVRLLAGLGASLDCTGVTEMQIGRLCGVSPDRMIINGNGKSEATLKAAAQGVRQVNIDSLDEARRLNELARGLGTQVACVVRIQPTYARLLEQDPAYAPVTTVWEGKFGVNVATGEALHVVDFISTASNLGFVGLQHHAAFSGVGEGYVPELDVMHHRECVREVCEFAGAVHDELGLPVERLDLGGGFPSGRGIYLVTPGNAGDGALHPLPATDAYARAIAETVREHFPPDRLPMLQFETGRYQVANAALLLTAVSDIKDGHSTPPRRYITVDASMQQFTSKGFTHTGSQVIAVERYDAPADGTITDVVGQTCAYDSLAEDMVFPELHVGDVLALTNHGAYCDTSGTNFNAMPRPATVMVAGGRAALVKRHETLMDVVGRHSGADLDWTELS